METAIALIVFGIIASLVMPNLLSKEILIGLVILGVLAIVMPRQFSREQVFAIISFGILFSLVIPPLLK